MVILVLTISFWVSVAALAGWLTVYTVGPGLIVGGLGERGARLVLTLLLGAVALTSGLLVAYHRLTSAFVDRDSYWSAAEVGYAVMLFMALFFGLYSFLGWYFYG